MYRQTHTYISLCVRAACVYRAQRAALAQRAMANGAMVHGERRTLALFAFSPFRLSLNTLRQVRRVTNNALCASTIWFCRIGHYATSTAYGFGEIAHGYGLMLAPSGALALALADTYS